LTALSRTVALSDAGAIHDALCRALDKGLDVQAAPKSYTFGSRTYWHIDSLSDPDAAYLVMVEQQCSGRVVVWCECVGFGFARTFCTHVALALDHMSLIPRTEAGK
jgi:hypothetical protein